MESAKRTKTVNRNRTADAAFIALGTALLAVCSWICIPMTIPVTMQTFAVFTVLLLLGGKRGTLSIITFILLGAAGIPVFSGFRGGPGVIFGTTGGYIVGFILTGIIYTAVMAHCRRTLAADIITLLAGLAACYILGTAWFMIVYARTTGPVGLMTALSWCVFPFIIPDLLKLVLAVTVSRRVRAAIPDSFN